MVRPATRRVPPGAAVDAVAGIEDPSGIVDVPATVVGTGPWVLDVAASRMVVLPGAVVAVVDELPGAVLDYPGSVDEVAVDVDELSGVVLDEPGVVDEVAVDDEPGSVVTVVGVLDVAGWLVEVEPVLLLVGAVVSVLDA
jgi:hypothetical protein